MEFTLFYRGPLKANRGASDKQLLRRYFHSQLKVLWQQPPLVHRKSFLNPTPPQGEISLVHAIGSFEFVPLVSSKIHMLAELDITLLRPGPPGRMIKSGDIDNRLKTLLDSIKMPQEPGELPKGDSPGENETPFFCVLEDDKLITKISIKTGQLLERISNHNEVVLLVQVHSKLTELTWANMGLG